MADASPEPEQKTLKEPFSSARARSGSGDEPLVEQCDGTRTLASSVDALQCRQWKVEWQQDGKAWGVVTASTATGVLTMRDRTMAFLRDETRFFDAPLDRRFVAGPAICDACRANDPAAPSGMFGDGQRFAGSEIRRAVTTAMPKADSLQKALLEQHVPRLRDVARYASDPKTSKSAKQYVKALHVALFDVARAKLWLENATVLQDKKLVDQAEKLVGGRVESLRKDYEALEDAIANELKRQYAGRWGQEGSDNEDKHLQVDFERLSVRANHLDGSSRSVWFEGTVNLDGSITGHSLVAPKNGETSCSDHTVACGFERVPSVLRFSQRREGPQGNRNVVELWFQQGSWVRAPLFSR